MGYKGAAEYADDSACHPDGICDVGDHEYPPPVPIPFAEFHQVQGEDPVGDRVSEKGKPPLMYPLHVDGNDGSPQQAAQVVARGGVRVAKHAAFVQANMRIGSALHAFVVRLRLNTTSELVVSSCPLKGVMAPVPKMWASRGTIRCRWCEAQHLHGLSSTCLGLSRPIDV